MYKYTIIIACLFLGLCFLTGCPLEIQKSIDSGSYDVPAFMRGKWVEVTKTGARKNAYDLRPYKNNKNRFKAYILDSAGKVGVKFYDVIMSSVAGAIYLNVYEPGDDETPEGYYILQFRKISENEFTLTGLKENVLNADASQADIVHFLTVNKDKPDILDLSDEYHYKKE